MKYRLLGNSGLRVSEAALGTMTFGDDWGWGTAKDEARKVYDAFRESGGRAGYRAGRARAVTARVPLHADQHPRRPGALTLAGAWPRAAGHRLGCPVPEHLAADPARAARPQNPPSGGAGFYV